MPDDPKTTVPAPLEKSAEQGEAEGSVATQEVEELAAEQTEGQTEASESVAEESPKAEETDVEAIDDATLDEFIAPPKEDKKDHVQRRIDQLTAQLKELKAENMRLAGEKGQQKQQEYTEAQLKGALKKAFDEGDPDLAYEVFEYKVTKMKNDLIGAYEAEKGKATAVVQDWNKVVNDYSRVWQDDSGKELYHGAKDELNLYSQSSLLYQLALKLYHSQDEDGSAKYATPGGQRMAVADALAMILRKRGPGAQDKRKLERALAKEKRKKSLATGGALAAEKSGPRRPMSEQEKLAEYMAERTKFKQERS